MIFNARTFNTLLDQYLANASEESRNGAAQGLRSEYHWCLRSQAEMFLAAYENERAQALLEIIAGAPDKPNHPVVDCSGGNFHLIGEALSR